MKNEELQKRLDQKRKDKENHVCIRIFEDESVYITNDKDKILRVKSPKPGEVFGPRNTYDQAMWYAGSPICVWHRGIRR